MRLTNLNAYYSTEYGKGLKSRRARDIARIRIIAVPEMGDNGDYSPCAYIRLLQPLDYLRELELIDFKIATAEEALKIGGDIFYCHRTSSCNEGSAVALARHARECGAKLFYDLDDNLLKIDEAHPESKQLSGIRVVVEKFLQEADAVFYSTRELKRQLANSSKRQFVMDNALDQRLIADFPTLDTEELAGTNQSVGIIYMGTYTHSHDFDLVSKVLNQVLEDFGDRVKVGILGVTPRSKLPSGIRRIYPPDVVGSSYPAFMSWLTARREWQIGISPLQDTQFNDAKSPIKALDYISMGAVPIVSDVEAYRSLPATAVERVANRPENWYKSIASLVSSESKRQHMAERGRDYFLSRATLEATVDERIETLAQAME
ncbi:MAG: hypothetical protein JW384_01041 [Nitrosomonadaceae bacterium]|nr:hypothetical protein [Nitrosomonadaceae bacterium]